MTPGFVVCAAPRIALLLLLAAPAVVAQSAFPVPVGSRVRLTLSGASPSRPVGFFAGVEQNRLLLRTLGGDTVPIPSDSVHWVERSLGRFNERRALLYGGVAFGLVTVVGIQEAIETDQNFLPFLAAAAGTGVVGGVVGGAGNRAAKVGAFFAGMGAIVGAVAASAAYEEPKPCPPDAAFCLDLDFGPGFNALAGAVAGGSIGFGVGSVIGAFTPGEMWGRPMAVDLRPAPSGGVALSVQTRY